MNFLIIAILSMAMTPACSVMSGKTSLLEICGWSGVKQIIALDENGSDNDNDQRYLNNKCTFCKAFFESPMISEAYVFEPLELPKHIYTYHQGAVFSKRYALSPDSRAPPVLVS